MRTALSDKTAVSTKTAMSAKIAMSTKTAIISTVVALSLGAVGNAIAEDYKPAAFSDDTLSNLEASVETPPLTEDYPVASVYCQTDVNQDGLTSKVACFERDGHDELRQQVEEAMTSQRFIPARVDGSTVPVRMVFRVVYAELDGQPPVMLLPNLGHMQGDFGYQYSAPQERLDGRDWHSLYASSDGEGQPFFSGDGELTRVMAWVKANGRVAGARSLEGHSEHRRDADLVEKALGSARFIPGMHNGKPERMRYVAVLHYPQ